ncbi:MAG: hypothetical protein F4X64_00165 [Chloroflexi bacterium]|nr:hypothetical protein [Chloroflexota bacterium]
MPATPHINFELLSEATITEDRGTRTYTATGLTIPTPDDEALVIQIGSRISYPFESLRLTSLERAAAGDEASAANGILLDEITAPNFSPDRIGLTSGDELLYAQSGQPTQVRIWHLRPDDIDISSLAAELAPRILPVPTEQRR